MMTGVRPQSQFDISPLDYYHYFRRDVEERTVTYLLGFLLSVTFLWGERPFTQTTKGIPGGLTRRLADVEHTVWDGNEISTWHGNHGDWVSYHSAGRPGLEWPKGSGKWAGFQSGLWLGSGRVRTPGSDWLEETRTAAVQYTSEFVPGTISGEGGHIYEIHRAELNAFLENDFSEFKRMTAELPITEGNQRVMTTVSFPTPDFENWPAHLGAPWVDANGDGAYHIEDGDHPDILGDQFHWYVMNDADTTAHRALWETAPMNVEVQTSLFGFDQSGPLGDVLFIRSVIINRGSEDLDSVFVSFWHDDDVGGSEDDLVACDTTLDLGYTYNDADGDDVYGVEVPAVGSDLFQGPVVYSEGDTASLLTWDLESGYHLKDVPDRRQLPMTSFVKYIRGDAVFHDPFTALEAYRSMNGLIGSSGRPFVNPLTGRPTNFVHAGDPVVGTGWLDGGYTPPGDRRYLLTSGPFQLAQGDTQEVVGGIIVGGGSTWERSIRKLKYFDKFAQGIFDGGFSICSPPGPTVTVAAMDKKIVLTFQEDSESIENYTCSDYRFEGYNIYQGESPNGPWHRLATYDVVNGVKVILDLVLDDATGELIEVPAQFGTDSGLQYYLEITYDEVNGRELINYRSYYYSVTAYGYDPAGAPRVIESSFSPMVAVPGPPGLGGHLASESGDTLLTVHASGISDARVNPLVIDPYRLTGDTYEVTFFEAGETTTETISTEKGDSWVLRDDTPVGGDEYRISGSGEGAGNSLSMEFNMIWFEEQVITQDTVEISSEVIGDTLIVTYVIESDTVLRTTSRKGGSLSFDYVDATGRRFDSSTPGSSVSMKVFYNGPDGSLRVNMSGRLYGVGLSNFDFVIVKVVLNRDDFSGSFVVSHLNYKGEPLQPYWRLINKTEDEIKVMSHTDITSGTELSIIDGFQLTVTDGSFDFPSRSQWWEQTVDADGDTLTKTIYRGEAGTWSEFLGSIGISGGSHDQTQLQKDIRFVFTDEPARGYYWDGSSTAVELRDVPFEVWTVEDSTRINVLVWVLRAGQEVIHYEDDLIDPATGEILGTVGRLWNGIVVPIYEPYSTSAYYSPWGEGSESLGWVMQFGFKETAFVPGDEAVVHFTNPIFPGIDIYTFTASGLEAASGDQVRDQLSALNVFPNPYFGNNPEETNLSGRFVTFTHLGAGHHVIRIFTLSGTLVKKIEQENMDENDPSNLIRWDLQNSAGNPVASGMYIAHVQSETKTGKYERVLKLAVFQPAKPIGVR